MSGAVLVTGASGFLGRPLVRALLAAERPVIALARNPDALAGLRHPELRVAVGDLGDPSSYGALLPAAGSVFHLAGVRNHPRVRAVEFEAVNVQAALALARRAGEAGVGRFVNVSTALIYGPSEGRARTEADELSPEGAYIRSKARAALEIRHLAAEGLPAVTVCPAIVFGPDHPSRPNRVTSEIRRLLRGRFAVLVAGGRQPRNLVFVDDVVAGLLAAEQRGRPGEEYLLGGEEATHRELAALVSSGRGPWRLSLPAGGAAAAAWILDRLRGHDPDGGYRAAVRTLLQPWHFSSAKARRELGYHPRPLVEGINRTIDWLREEETG